MVSISGIQLASGIIRNNAGPLDAKQRLSTLDRLSLTSDQAWIGMQVYDTDLSSWLQLTAVDASVTSNWEEIGGGGGGGGVTSVTYEDFTTAITGSTLVPGTTYQITDYATVRDRDPGNSDWGTGATETLLVTATSPKTYSNLVRSVQYPQDIIIWDHAEVVNGSSGRIVYRKDTTISFEADFDRRVVTMKRRNSTISTQSGYFARIDTNVTLGSATMTPTPADFQYNLVVNQANTLSDSSVIIGYSANAVLLGDIRSSFIKGLSNTTITGSLEGVKILNGLNNSVIQTSYYDVKHSGSVKHNNNYIFCLSMKNCEFSGVYDDNVIDITTGILAPRTFSSFKLDGYFEGNTWTGNVSGGLLEFEVTNCKLTGYHVDNTINIGYMKNVDIACGSGSIGLFPPSGFQRNNIVMARRDNVKVIANTMTDNVFNASVLSGNNTLRECENIDINCDSITSNSFGYITQFSFIGVTIQGSTLTELDNVFIKSFCTSVVMAAGNRIAGSVFNRGIGPLTFDQSGGGFIGISNSVASVLVEGASIPTITFQNIDYLDNATGNYYEYAVSAGSVVASLLRSNGP